MFSEYRRLGALATAVFCATSLALAGLINDGLHWIVWGVGGCAVLLLVLLLVRAMPPRRGAVAFIVVALEGVLFMASSKLELPASLPVWAWIVLAFGMATVGLLEDAELAQSTPRNRL